MSKKKPDHTIFDQMNKKKNPLRSGQGAQIKPQAPKGGKTQHRSVNHGNHK